MHGQCCRCSLRYVGESYILGTAWGEKETSVFVISTGLSVDAEVLNEKAQCFSHLSSFYSTLSCESVPKSGVLV